MPVQYSAPLGLHACQPLQVLPLLYVARQPALIQKNINCLRNSALDTAAHTLLCMRDATTRVTIRCPCGVPAPSTYPAPPYMPVPLRATPLFFPPLVPAAPLPPPFTQPRAHPLPPTNSPLSHALSIPYPPQPLPHPSPSPYPHT
jgi:hypothetical protein